MDKKLCVVVNECNRNAVLNLAKNHGLIQRCPEYPPSDLLIFNYMGHPHSVDYAKNYPSKEFWSSQGHTIIDLNKQSWEEYTKYFDQAFVNYPKVVIVINDFIREAVVNYLKSIGYRYTVNSRESNCIIVNYTKETFCYTVVKSFWINHNFIEVDLTKQGWNSLTDLLKPIPIKKEYKVGPYPVLFHIGKEIHVNGMKIKKETIEQIVKRLKDGPSVQPSRPILNIYVGKNPALCEAVQKFLFSKGFMWGDHTTNIQRIDSQSIQVGLGSENTFTSTFNIYTISTTEYNNILIDLRNEGWNKLEEQFKEKLEEQILIVIGGHTVVFNDSTKSIGVGCVNVSLNECEAILDELNKK